MDYERKTLKETIKNLRDIISECVYLESDTQTVDIIKDVEKKTVRCYIKYNVFLKVCTINM